MATPSRKDPEIYELMDTLAGNEPGRAEALIAGNVCSSCAGPATEFTGALQAKEFTLSGLCEKCQAEVFGAPTVGELMDARARFVDATPASDGTPEPVCECGDPWSWHSDTGECDFDGHFWRDSRDVPTAGRAGDDG